MQAQISPRRLAILLGTLVALAAGVYNYHGYVFQFLPFLPIAKALILSFLIGTIMLKRAHT